MERRKNTLDRWQRLRFGRRAASNPPEDKGQPSADADASAAKRSSDKSERLRELTELLKGARHQSIPPNLEGGSREPPPPPPLPPPRKPRQPDGSGCVDKFIDTSASESGSPISGARAEHSRPTDYSNTLRPNASTSQLDQMTRHYRLPSAKDNSLFKEFVRSSDSTQNEKVPPIRSASFSQVDYSSGKYIRSAFGALRALTKSKTPPVVDNTNLTLPRSRRDRSRTPSPAPDRFASAPSSPPEDLQDVWIPLKPTAAEKSSTRNELNLNLLGANSADVIIEEDSENSPTADSKESKYVVPQSPPVAPHHGLPTFKLIEPSQLRIDALPNEDGLMSSPEDFFQTASTCMIPVPVYECTARDWVEADLADQWINASEIDSAKIVEEGTLDLPSSMEQALEESIPIVVQEQCDQTEKERSSEAAQAAGEKARSPTLELDSVPAIAVTPGSSVSGSFDEVDVARSVDSDKGDNEEAAAGKTADSSGDYVVEVRKRHSKDLRRGDNCNSDHTQSTSGSGASSPKGSLDEKRKIDKSKRRKGIYIQWAALDKHKKELLCGEAPRGSSGAEDVGQPIWPEAFEGGASTERKPTNSSLESESDADVRETDLLTAAIADKLRMGDRDKHQWLSCTSPDEAQTPASLEPTTPDSEYGRPVWPKSGDAKIRRQSFSLQSSEEKDEYPSLSSPRAKPYKNMFILRSDSISDNELSDRTPPPRDRASQSPAPGESDLKRYSKRPLRGPYGQMLEAEMKKPNKQNYDGLLEELNRSER